MLASINDDLLNVDIVSCIKWLELRMRRLDNEAFMSVLVLV